MLSFYVSCLFWSLTAGMNRKEEPRHKRSNYTITFDNVVSFAMFFGFFGMMGEIMKLVF